MASENTLINRDGAEQHLFYNVMPVLSDTKHIVEQKVAPKPTIVEQKTTPDAKDESLGSAMAQGKQGSGRKRLILVIIIIIAVFGLGVGAYWYFTSEPPEEELTVPEIKTEEPAPAPEPEPIPEVTAPKEWLAQYFGKETCTDIAACGDAADTERDGLINIDEYRLGTDPNNRDSDGDGLADGDEVHVFTSSPTRSRTASDPDYNDTDYAKGGYDVATKQLFSATKLREVKEAMRTHGLHPPTLQSLGDTLLEIYGFTEDQAANGSTQPKGSELPLGFEATPEAKLDRDSQRMATIKKIGLALVTYKETAGTYPPGGDFTLMADKINPYLGSATNIKDPINEDPFVYGYTSESAGSAFTLTYYSETQEQLIRYKSTTAEQDSVKSEAQGADEQRKDDLASIRAALLLYGAASSVASSGEFFIFPPKSTYKTDLVPDFMTTLPKDPTTGKDYEYEVAELFDSFTVKAILENQESGTTGWLCNQEECRPY